MKRTKIIALAAAFSVTLTALPMLVYGDVQTYDPENDPLVSLSYIDEVVRPEYDEKIEELEELISELDSVIGGLNKSLGKANDKINELEKKLAAAPEAASDGYEVVYMTQGTKLLAQSPCEIILRSGSAIVVSITSNGLNNITNGTELLNAADVPLYNCLIVPRGGDGRGIHVTSADAYVMVRGDYQIVR